MSYLCTYSPPAPQQLAPRTMVSPCQEMPAGVEGRGQQAHVGGFLHDCTQSWSWLTGVTFVVWPSETPDDWSSFQPPHLVLLLHSRKNRGGQICPGSARGTLQQEVSWHLQR